MSDFNNRFSDPLDFEDDNLPFYDPEKVKRYFEERERRRRESKLEKTYSNETRTDIVWYNPQFDKIQAEYQTFPDENARWLFSNGFGFVPILVTRLSDARMVLLFTAHGVKFSIYKRFEKFAVLSENDAYENCRWNAHNMKNPLTYDYAKTFEKMLQVDGGTKTYILQKFYGKDAAGEWFIGFIEVD